METTLSIISIIVAIIAIVGNYHCWYYLPDRILKPFLKKFNFDEGQIGQWAEKIQQAKARGDSLQDVHDTVDKYCCLNKYGKDVLKAIANMLYSESNYVENEGE